MTEWALAHTDSFSRLLHGLWIGGLIVTGLAVATFGWLCWTRRWALGGAALAVIVLGGATLMFAHTQRTHLDELMACRQNVFDLEGAIETYEAANNGKMPTGMNDLVPQYLANMPTCPVTGTDTYSDTYVTNGDAFTIYCGGNHHVLLGKPLGTMPRCTSFDGLVP